METKYSKLIQLQDKNISAIENQILEKNHLIELAKKDIKVIEKEILSAKPPQFGDFSIMQQFHKGIWNMNNDIKKIENKISMLNSEKNLLYKHLKNANIEKEKFIYLENQILLKEQERLRKKEQSDLDEVAVMLFNQQKKRL